MRKEAASKSSQSEVKDELCLLLSQASFSVELGLRLTKVEDKSESTWSPSSVLSLYSLVVRVHGQGLCSVYGCSSLGSCLDLQFHIVMYIGRGDEMPKILRNLAISGCSRIYKD